MRRFVPVAVVIVLCLVTLLQPSCVLLRGGSCVKDSECEAYHVCFRNWCMPETVRKRLQDVIDARKKEAAPGDAGGEVSPPEVRAESSPEVAPDKPPTCTETCTPGKDTRPCYPSKGCGTDGKSCQGSCKAGTETCEQTGACPTWSKCVGAVEPTEETCNNEDDDCDGSVDEELTKPCYSGPANTQTVGACKGGTQTCNAGRWSGCVGEVTPKTEDCEGTVDEDCDGTVDEGCACTIGKQEPCGKTEGECKQGTKICGANGKWETCKNAIEPKKEVCDGKDNNCDGTIDEGLTRKCYGGKPPTSEGVGPCKGGTETCNAGKWGLCIGQVTPKTETCNNADDDCDGSVDNGLKRPCYGGPNGTKGVGVCKGGEQTCVQGKWGTCDGEIQPTTETCNGRDDDCNSKVDETCQCQQGKTQACGSDVGECKKGTQACTTTGAWGTCVGETKSKAETCNGKDDDCNGKVDDIPPTDCYKGPPNTRNVKPCKDGKEECSGTNIICKGEVKPATETCNNIDDDCDGSTDEGLTRPCYTGPSGTQGKGACKGGTQTCRAGGWGTCAGEVTPKPEKCDGSKADYDCDGKTEDGCVTTFAGNGTAGFKDGTGTAAMFNKPAAMVIDGSELYVIDTGNYRVRQVGSTGIVTTIAGDGTKGFKFGPALSAQFDELCGIAKPGANMFVTEHKTHTIRQVLISTSNPSLNDVQLFAGRKNDPGTGIVNGDLSTARFNGPCGIAVDSANNIYVAELGNHAIRKISFSATTSKWTVETFTGGNGVGQKDGEKGIAQFDFTSARPKLVFHQGKLYLNDSTSIRVVDMNGKVATYVGYPMTNPTYQVIIWTGIFTFSSIMYFVRKISGEIYRVNPPSSYTIKFAGTASGGFLDGTLSTAKFGDIGGFVASGSDFFVSDKTYHRIRKITSP